MIRNYEEMYVEDIDLNNPETYICACDLEEIKRLRAEGKNEDADQLAADCLEYAQSILDAYSKIDEIDPLDYLDEEQIRPSGKWEDLSRPIKAFLKYHAIEKYCKEHHIVRKH